MPPLPLLAERPDAEPASRRRTFFTTGTWHDTPVFQRNSFADGQALTGPAIIEQLDATTLIFPGDRGVVDAWGNLIVTLAPGNES